MHCMLIQCMYCIALTGKVHVLEHEQPLWTAYTVYTHDNVKILSDCFSLLHPLIFLSGLIGVATMVCKNSSCHPSQQSAVMRWCKKPRWHYVLWHKQSPPICDAAIDGFSIRLWRWQRVYKLQLWSSVSLLRLLDGRHYRVNKSKCFCADPLLLVFPSPSFRTS